MGYTINRKLYKDIKKYDHQQMSDFLTKIYIEGKKAAVEDLAEERMKDIKRVQIDNDELKNRLLTIKGVGIVKANEIIKIINEMVGGAADDNESTR